MAEHLDFHITREPEFCQRMGSANPFCRMPLKALLLEYQRATLRYHSTAETLGTQNPAVEVAWTQLSFLNGELMRRVYASQNKALQMFAEMRARMAVEVMADGHVPPTDAQLAQEQRDAETPPE